MRAPTRISRFRFSEVVEDPDGRTFLTEHEPFRYRERPDNIAHVVVDGDDLWTIAGTYYARSIVGGETLFWVVGDYQPEPVHDPTVALVPGSVVVVPSVRVVLEEILSEGRRASGVRLS